VSDADVTIRAYVAVTVHGCAQVIWWDCPHESLAEFWSGTVEGECYDAETSVANWFEHMGRASDGLYILTIGGYSPEWDEDGIDEFRIQSVRTVLLKEECGKVARLRAAADAARAYRVAEEALEAAHGHGQQQYYDCEFTRDETRDALDAALREDQKETT